MSGENPSGQPASSPPAFHIPLSDQELKLLGELTAILGQVDWFMTLTVMNLLGIKLAAAQKLMGSTNVRTNADVWLSIINERATDKHVKGLAEALVKQLFPAVAEGRNDFIHSIFAGKEPPPFGFSFSKFPQDKLTVAVRVKNLKTTPMTELVVIRNKAADLSQFVYHIYCWTSGIPGTQPNFNFPPPPSAPVASPGRRGPAPSQHPRKVKHR
jgi:hypothetical protein